jgi:CRISPR-associated protein Cas5h
MEEQFIAFDWHGFIGHFRKLDTNSSSLSYSFPPPTVISGMLAGLCGMERDQYYNIFSPDNIQFGIQIRQRTRKIMQTINYMFVKSKNELNLSAPDKHTQIPIELLVADNFPRTYLSFRIFLKITEPSLFAVLHKFLSENVKRYLPYMGSAPFQSWLDVLDIKSVSIDSDAKSVRSVVPAKVLKNANMFLQNEQKFYALFFEHMRRFFHNEREPGEMIDLVWEQNHGEISSQFSTLVYRFEFDDDSTNVIFF